MKRGASRMFESEEAGMNMTPMIDIVFQLIIFFMVVTELSNLNMAQVTLPRADWLKVEKERAREDREVVINVSLQDESENRRGIISIGTNRFAKADGTPDLDGLKKYLLLETQEYDKWEPSPTDPTQQDSLLKALIRADENVRSEYLHLIYEACRTARIYKVQVGAQRRGPQEE